MTLLSGSQFLFTQSRQGFILLIIYQIRMVNTIHVFLLTHVEEIWTQRLGKTIFNLFAHIEQAKVYNIKKDSCFFVSVLAFRGRYISASLSAGVSRLMLFPRESSASTTSNKKEESRRGRKRMISADRLS
ncbi:hypothetical protein FITA111629_11875 [Filibacter tadaridae]|uniref:Uncharacterized protein n=1 Tax=Filibacter tadaridae TaxID=2483811 RepID=A0A3P5WHG1_9BACL|nr:hypothetical protein FILTAD_00572 [Filibacter tadaridae]